MTIPEITKYLANQGAVATFGDGVLAVRGLRSWADYLLVAENADALLLIAVARDVFERGPELRPLDRGSSSCCCWCEYYDLNGCGRGATGNKVFRVEPAEHERGCEHFIPGEVFF